MNDEERQALAAWLIDTENELRALLRSVTAQVSELQALTERINEVLRRIGQVNKNG